MKESIWNCHDFCLLTKQYFHVLDIKILQRRFQKVMDMLWFNFDLRSFWINRAISRSRMLFYKNLLRIFLVFYVWVPNFFTQKTIKLDVNYFHFSKLPIHLLCWLILMNHSTQINLKFINERIIKLLIKDRTSHSLVFSLAYFVVISWFCNICLIS